MCYVVMIILELVIRMLEYIKIRKSKKKTSGLSNKISSNRIISKQANRDLNIISSIPFFDFLSNTQI